MMIIAAAAEQVQ